MRSYHFTHLPKLPIENVLLPAYRLKYLRAGNSSERYCEVKLDMTAGFHFVMTEDA